MCVIDPQNTLKVPEVLENIFSFIPEESLRHVCKLWHRVCTITYFSQYSNYDDKLVSFCISKINNMLTFTLFQERLPKDAKFKIHLCINNLQDKLPFFTKLVKIENYKVVGVNITNKASQEDVTALCSLFNPENIYFTDPQKLPFSPGEFQYPTSVKKLFFKNIIFTPEEIEELFATLSACPNFRKLIIETPYNTETKRPQYPRKELQEGQASKQWEIETLEPMKYYLVPPAMLNQGGAVGGPRINSERFLSYFWNNENTDFISHAEKFAEFFSIPSFKLRDFKADPLFMQTLEGPVLQDLEKLVKAKPTHVLALCCLGALKLFLSEDENMESAKQLLETALEIEPDNGFANVLLMGLLDLKCNTDESFQEETRELIKKVFSLPFDKKILSVICAILEDNKEGFFANTPEGACWDPKNQSSVPKIDKKEQYMFLNFNYLRILAPFPGSTKKSDAYNQWLQICCTRYPSYKPFLLARSGDTEWKKAFHPEEFCMLEGLLKKSSA